MSTTLVTDLRPSRLGHSKWGEERDGLPRVSGQKRATENGMCMRGEGEVSGDQQ